VHGHASFEKNAHLPQNILGDGESAGMPSTTIVTAAMAVSNLPIALAATSRSRHIPALLSPGYAMTTAANLGKSRKLRLALCGLGLALAGCSRHDTECLGNLGRKVLDHSHANTESLREKLELDFGRLAVPRGLKESVEARLTLDALLAGVKIEVRVTEEEVELRGTVKNEAQRTRALDITSTTVGVQRVSDLLKVQDDMTQQAPG
jgi:hypothetical protein